MTQMRIADITVGERRRSDMGDIDALATSIDKVGLIHAIVVDPSGRLVAGGRRLAACQTLGMKWIEVRQWDELTDAELREIELEENLRRKDLTESERSRTLVARAETVREIEQSDDELRAVVARNSGRGRPATPGSYRDVSRRIDVPESTIRRAEQHVAAIESYPELESLPQVTAIKAAKALDSAPAETRDEARERIKQEQATSERVLSVVADLVPGARDRMEAASLRTTFTRGVESTGNLTQIKPAAIASALGHDDIEHAQRFIARTRRWLDELESEIGSGIRLVASESN